MKISEECLRHAAECEREAAACCPGSSRDALLETAVVWRRMAETAALEEATWHVITSPQQQLQQAKRSEEPEPKAQEQPSG